MASHLFDHPEASYVRPVRPGPEGGRRRRTYSVPEVAELLGISRSTAYECVRRGEIPALRFGQRLVVPVQAIEELLVVRRECGDVIGPEREHR